MTVCYQHPDRTAVEHCEVCQRALCGSCLWYAESGERLCPDHAAEWLQAGQTVTPPTRYAEGIVHSEASAARPAQPRAPYTGNSTDVTALLSAAGGLISLLSCFGLAYVMPLVVLGMGLVSWMQAKDSLDPKRTRMLAGIGIGTALALIVGFIFFMSTCFIFPMFMALISSSRSSFP